MDFLRKYLQACLKHRQIIEEEIIPNAPEDIKPKANKAKDYSIDSYNKARDILRSQGQIVQDNPFDSE